jgi:SAM-dependent methyltransferase
MNNQLHILAEENGKSLFQIAIPRYLEETYWWAYVHPKAVTIFEKQWIVNLILLGNFARLRDAALDELGQEIDGRILQIACVYGDFSVKLAERLTRNSSLDIVDVLPVQLENARRKIPKTASVQILQRDSARLNFPDACSFDSKYVTSGSMCTRGLNHKRWMVVRMAFLVPGMVGL